MYITKQDLRAITTQSAIPLKKTHTRPWATNCPCRLWALYNFEPSIPFNSTAMTSLLKTSIRCRNACNSEYMSQSHPMRMISLSWAGMSNPKNLLMACFAYATLKYFVLHQWGQGLCILRLQVVAGLPRPRLHKICPSLRIQSHWRPGTSPSEVDKVQHSNAKLSYKNSHWVESAVLN